MPISREVRGFPNSALLDTLYRTNFWTIGAIFFIALTFAGSYLLNGFAKSYLKGHSLLYLISSPEIAHAILERSIMAGILLVSTSPWRFLILLSVGVLRLPFKLLRERTAFLLSLAYAVLVTLLFQRIL